MTAPKNSAMTLTQFLEYLHEHSTTVDLAEDLGEVLVLRGHRELVPFALDPHARRAAS